MMSKLAEHARAFPAVLLIAGSVVTLSAVPASAASIVVTTTADQLDVTPNGHCSLREAVQSAESDTAIGGCTAGASGSDLIVLGPLTYTLTIDGQSEQASLTGDLDLAGTVTIRGHGARRTRIVGGATFGDRPFHIESGATVGISGLSIVDGDSADGFGGGGIFNQGTLTLTDVAVTSSESNVGAGGVRNDGTMMFTGGAVSGNQAFTNAGGLLSQGTSTLRNVTISGNSARIDGGGIQQIAGTVSLDHVTITNNVADSDGSGGGESGGGFAGSAITLARSIIAGNAVATSSGGDCLGSATSGGYNVLGSASCVTALGTGDVVGSASVLPLLNNGGQSDTHAIGKTSLAYRRVLSGCAATDQRGAPRGSRCDSGAYNLVFCLDTPVNRVGTAGDDDIVGTSGRDGILALDGNDFVEGFGGADRICGGGGKDKMKGQGGGDRIAGGGGKDTLMGGGGNDRLSGGGGNDRINGASGRDRCRGGSGRNTLISCER